LRAYLLRRIACCALGVHAVGYCGCGYWSGKWGGEFYTDAWGKTFTAPPEVLRRVMGQR